MNDVDVSRLLELLEQQTEAINALAESNQMLIGAMLNEQSFDGIEACGDLGVISLGG